MLPYRGKALNRARRVIPAAALALLGGLLFAAPLYESISAEALHSTVNWLAADERQGRLAPSPGLEASADFIAGRFREAGLSPGGGDGSYFQTAPFSVVTPETRDFQFSLAAGSQSIAVPSSSVDLAALTQYELRSAPVVRLHAGQPIPEIAGAIVAGGDSWDTETSVHRLRAQKPALIMIVIPGHRPPGNRPVLMEADASVAPVMRIYNKAAAGLLSRPDPLRLTLHAHAPARRDVTLRNVAGILRGSDPAVRNQFVIVSAHYDHLGSKPPGPGNRIFHGANDDASGVASLIEIAKAINESPRHPRRSLLFLSTFGEEEGLLGSAYYVRHPLVPIDRTVAGINLEQLGRTDSSDGPEIGRFALTGPSFSNLPAMVSAAAKQAGVVVYRKDTADEYFDRSDNFSFALEGIVSHTAVVAFEFPDYHQVSDLPEKLDYANMAKVDRGIAAGIAAVADAAEPPKWSDATAARPYKGASR